MEVVICSDEHEIARLAADRVVADVEGTNRPILGVATGSSPLKLYAELASRVEAGDVDFSHGEAFALDEYVGLPPEHPQSYRHTIMRTVAQPLGFEGSRVHVPNGYTADLQGEAEKYDAAIVDRGGVDVQILGIGSNGHIGFNEPMSSLGSRTRVKTLTQQTREDNARFFDSIDEVPTHCVTQGIGTIMDAKAIVLVAQGAHKANAIAAMVEGPVTASCPGSILQLHPRVFVAVDEAAASKLQHAAYFRHAAATPLDPGV